LKLGTALKCDNTEDADILPILDFSQGDTALVNELEAWMQSLERQHDEK